MRRRREAGSQKRSKASGCQVSGNPPLKSRQHTQAGQMRYDVNGKRGPPAAMPHAPAKPNGQNTERQ